MLIDQYVYQQRLAKQPAGIAAEQRLWATMLGTLLMPISLFWFAWTARPGVHWMVSLVAAAFFGRAINIIFVRISLPSFATWP